MSKPQHPISIPFSRGWNIRRPYLYRYMKREYVDRFFDDGTLRLSSFSYFGKHPDEERGDNQEGRGVVIHRNAEGEGQTILSKMAKGIDTFILCGSMRFSDDLARAFDTDSGFRIDDTTAFSDIVARHIPGFVQGAEGPCMYMARRMVVRDMGRIDFEAMKKGPGENYNIDKLLQVMNTMAGDDLFYIKLIKYAHQSEYRLIWGARQIVGDYIEIKCPEALQFCTRFEDLIAERA